MDKFENAYTGPTLWAAKTTDPWLDVILCCFLLKFFTFEHGDLNVLLYTGPHKLCTGSYVHKILCMMPIRMTKYLFQAFLWWSMRAQSGLTFCDPMTPRLLCPWIFQAIVLEWIAIFFSRGSSQSRDRTRVSHIVDRSFTVINCLIPILSIQWRQ